MIVNSIADVCDPDNFLHKLLPAMNREDDTPTYQDSRLSSVPRASLGDAQSAGQRLSVHLTAFAFIERSTHSNKLL